MTIMNQNYTPNDLRKFGFILGGLFALIFGVLIPTIAKHQIPMWPWYTACALWVPAVIYPKSLTLVYKIWMKIGDVLGFINTRIILAIIFFLIIWPIGLLKRMVAKDVMGKRFEPHVKSYRTVLKPKDIHHMEKPF